MSKLLFSYGGFVSNVNNIGIDGIEESFLETKELASDDLEGLDQDAQNKLGAAYDDFVLARLKGQLEEYGASLGMQEGLQEVRTEYEIGFLFKAECSLAAFDHIFRKISEETHSLYVYDFTSMLYQGYDEGDYDTGSLSDDPEDYIDYINNLMSELADQEIVPEKTDLDELPVWRIFGECMLRCNKDLLPVDGIEVCFDGYATDDDDEEDKDQESYLITVPFKDGTLSFLGYLTNCQDLPQVDWSYIEEKYQGDIEEQLEREASGSTKDEFEEHVRDLFKLSIAMIADNDDDEEEEDDDDDDDDDETGGTVNLVELYEMDRGTLSPRGIKNFLKNCEYSGTPYVPYHERMGRGLATLSSVVKRELDKAIMPDFLEALEDMTDDRFSDAYCDVKIYPQTKELCAWKNSGDWDGTTLHVQVALVLSVPPDDSLDTMTRMTLLSQFDVDSMLETIGYVIGSCNFDDFSSGNFNGYSLEIVIDACPEEDFEKLSTAAKGVMIQTERLNESDKNVTPCEITLENAETEVPVLITAIAGALGVKLDPDKLQSSDSLYALMGFDDRLTKSLEASITGHFDVLGMVGGNQMVTVGNAIEFAQEILESRSISDSDGDDA